MNHTIKIAFFDIDGTLASNKIQNVDILERIPYSAKEALKCLKENGILPVIATGRGKLTIQTLIESLGMDSYIAANGGSVVYKGQEIHKHFLENILVSKIANQLMTLEDISVYLETTTGIIECKKEMMDKEDFSKHSVYEIAVIGQDLREKVYLEIEGIKSKMVAPIVMNILPEHISKAFGISKLLSLLQLDKSQAIAFGDEENDLEMFGAVENSVAMGNAVVELKNNATYVTDNVENDGIYKACKHFGLI